MRQDLRQLPNIRANHGRPQHRAHLGRANSLPHARANVPHVRAEHVADFSKRLANQQPHEA